MDVFGVFVLLLDVPAYFGKKLRLTLRQIYAKLNLHKTMSPNTSTVTVSLPVDSEMLAKEKALKEMLHMMQRQRGKHHKQQGQKGAFGSAKSKYTALTRL